MPPTGKSLVKPKFLTPGSLSRGRVPSLKTPSRPRTLVAQNPSEMSPNHEFESEPGGGATRDGATATKENSVFEEHGEHVDQQLPSWFKRDILLQANGENGERGDNSGDNGSKENEKSAVGSVSGSNDGNSGQSRKRKQSNGSKRCRGRNKVRQVATLKSGQKLNVEFYNNGPVGTNHNVLSRHIGKLVRDRNMLPITVRSWNEIDSKYLDKLWDAIVDKFEGGDIEHRRKDIMSQARNTWNKWRGEMNKLHLKNKATVDDALKPNNTPKGLLEEDWEWLVLEHYTDPEFIIKSVRNSENRALLNNPSRTGSKPIRQVIFDDLGGKDGKEPSIAEIFRETRKKKDGTLEQEDAATYDKIVEESTKNPSMSRFDLVEKCFGPQDRDRVICFGFGTKPKDIRGPEPSKADLKVRLQEKDQLIAELTNRVEKIEDRDANYQKEINEMQATYQREVGELHDQVKMLKDLILKQQSNTASPSSPAP